MRKQGTMSQTQQKKEKKKKKKNQPTYESQSLQMIKLPEYIAMMFNKEKREHIKSVKGTSLAVQGLRLYLPMQRVQVPSLAGELGSQKLHVKT